MTSPRSLIGRARRSLHTDHSRQVTTLANRRTGGTGGFVKRTSPFPLDLLLLRTPQSPTRRETLSCASTGGAAANQRDRGYRASQQEPRDRGRHEVGQCPREHRAQPEARQVVAAGRSQRADAADLDADRAEVGEAAQREGGDGERLRIERPGPRPELCTGETLSSTHTGSQ